MKVRLKRFLSVLLILLAAVSFAACFGSSSPKTAEYSITYHLNGGKPSKNQYYDIIDDDTVLVTIEQVMPPTGGYRPLDVKRETWFFDGWYNDKELTDKFEILPADNQTVHLYAKWTDKITVTKENFAEWFNVKSRWNGSTVVGFAEVNYSFEPKFTIDPKRSDGGINVSATPRLASWSGVTRNITLSGDNDFSFSGGAPINKPISFHLSDATLSYDVDIDGGSVDLYLLHKDAINVTLELDGGTLETGVISVAGGDVLKEADLPVPAKTGYRFMGWYADAEFKTQYRDTKITSEISVYAKFIKEAVITFDTQGGAEKESIVFLEGEALNLGDDPTKEDFGFFGWYTDPECTEKFTETVAAESRTLYAQWEPYRTIMFDTRGGEVKEAVKYLNTQPVNVEDLGEATHGSGYIFDGWFTDAECTQKYCGGAITKDITLFARWCLQYTGLRYNINENFYKFFNVDVSLKRENNRLITHVSIALKEEFKNFYFILMFDLNGDYKGADGTFYGNFIEAVSISALNGNYSYEFDKEVGFGCSGYSEIERVDFKFSCDYSEIRLPVGYELN